MNFHGRDKGKRQDVLCVALSAPPWLYRLCRQHTLQTLDHPEQRLLVL